MPTNPQSADRPTPGRASLGLIALSGLALLAAGGPLGTDMYLPSLPLIGDELQATTAQTQLTITAYMVGMASGQLLIGPISDALGRRRLLIGGMVLGLLASIVIALAPTIGVMIAGRLVQGIAGGTGVVLARAVIADLVTGVAAARAFSGMMLIIGVAPIVAPVFGGFINELTHWRGVFWTLAIIAMAQILVAIATPESHPPERRATGGPWRMYRNMGALMLRPAFIGYALAFAFGFGTMFSYIAGSSYVFQDIFGMSPIGFSLFFAANAIALVGANSTNIRLVGHLGPHRMQAIAVGCLAVGASSVFVFSLLLPQDANWSLILIVIAVFIATFGNGLNMSNSTALAQDLAAGWAGAASALLGAGQFIVAGVVSPLVGLGSDRLFTMALCMVVAMSIAVAGSVVARIKEPGEWQQEG